MPWQQDVLDVGCEIDPATGLYFYREVIVVVLRQAGKTSMSRAKISHRCVTQPRSSVLYTAQDRNMARRRLEKSFLDPLDASPLGGLLAPANRPNARRGWDGANGREKVKFANGSEIFIIAAQKKTAGHGDTLPEAHLDEYFAQVDNRLEQAVAPTMITVAGAQRWVTSATGDASSVPLWTKVEAARARAEAGVHGRTAYFEYSAPLDADRDDPATWRATHPAIGFTIDLDDIAADHDALEDAEFDRAYLGWWPRAADKPWVIPKASWRDAAEKSTGDWSGEPIWALDVAPERDMAAIGFAATSTTGKPWLELVAHEFGETWLIPHLLKLRSQFGGKLVVLDGAGPAAALQPELEAEGFIVRRLTAREKVDACGALHRAALMGALEHGNDPRVDAALAGAGKRKSGDAFVWSRGLSSVDITPLYALTMARFAWVDYEPYDPLQNIY